MMQKGGSNINRTTIFITLLFFCSTMSFAAVGGKQILSAFSKEKRGRIAICNNIRHSSSLSTQCSKSHCMVNNINMKNKQGIVTSLYTTKTSDDENYGDFNTLLPFVKHTHNSIKISIDEDDSNNGSKDAYDISTFQSKLQATLDTANELHKSAMWIDVDISRSNLISQAAQLGFQYHHASGAKATLCKWLIEHQESRIPEYATHQVGVGAMVINPVKDEILVVREARNNYRPWKIPGGLTELGEHLDEAAVREVYEETGIECSFNNVLAMRHTHNMQFGRSDMYFVCKLMPKTDEDGKVQVPVPQEGEIAAAEWLPMKEYRAMVFSDDPKVGHPMMKRIVQVLDESSEIERFVVPSIVPGRKLSPLYHAPIQSKESKIN